jgi:hypothetical protein
MISANWVVSKLVFQQYMYVCNMKRVLGVTASSSEDSLGFRCFWLVSCVLVMC